jgi:hypothetical protein
MVQSPLYIRVGWFQVQAEKTALSGGWLRSFAPSNKRKSNRFKAVKTSVQQAFFAGFGIIGLFCLYVNNGRRK